MADSKVSALTQVASGIATQEFPVNETGTSKKMTISQVAEFVNISGIRKSISSDASTHSTTAMVRVSGMDVASIGAGTYVFEYYIRLQCAGTTQTPKFAVNHTGTTTVFCYNLFFPSQGVAASTGVVDQEQNTTTGQVWSVESTRVKNTTLGPMTDVDTLNADIIFRISGLMVVTVTGTLELYHGCEINGTNITVKSGTCLLLHKVG